MQMTSIDNLTSDKIEPVSKFQKQSSMMIPQVQVIEAKMIPPTSLGFSSSLLALKKEVTEVYSYIRAPKSRFRVVYLDFDLEEGLKVQPLLVQKLTRPSIEFSVKRRSKMVNMNDLLSGTSSSIYSTSFMQERLSIEYDRSSDKINDSFNIENEESKILQTNNLGDKIESYSNSLIESIMKSSCSSCSSPSKGNDLSFGQVQAQESRQETNRILASFDIKECSRKLNITQGMNSEFRSRSLNFSSPKYHAKQLHEIGKTFIYGLPSKNMAFKSNDQNQIKFIKKSNSFHSRKIISRNLYDYQQN